MQGDLNANAAQAQTAAARIALLEGRCDDYEQRFQQMEGQPRTGESMESLMTMMVAQLQEFGPRLNRMDASIQRLVDGSEDSGRFSPRTRSGSGRVPQSQESSPDVKSTANIISNAMMNTAMPVKGVDINYLREEDKRQEDYLSVFSWLNWAPPPGSKCVRALRTHFPASLPGQAVHARVNQILMGEKYGFTPENTLFGTSICPDEINNEKGDLAYVMQEHWGEVFPLGGIGGAPFVGKTGFKAFSTHVPEDGHVLILFGPHVAVSENGDIGKCLRPGQKEHSEACGAVVGAYNACLCGQPARFDPADMEMWWIRKQIEPHCQRIKAEPEPLAALAFQAYVSVRDKLLTIANNDFGTGNLVLVGGIQINMPMPYDDHFLPLMFRVTRQGHPTQDLLSEFLVDASDAESHGGGFMKHFHWLQWTPPLVSPAHVALQQQFPKALPGLAVHARIVAALEGKKFDLTPDNTLYGNSICPDEINSLKGEMADVMKSYWGECFPLGGISGAPFVGKTGFGAFSAHVPDGGNIFLFYGPHVGISEDGEVGYYVREGQHGNKSTACGAVIGAYKACGCAGFTRQRSGDSFSPCNTDNDMQMDWIKRQIQPQCMVVSEDPYPMAALSKVAYNMVSKQVDNVVNNDFGSGLLVLVGGIMINMPRPYVDHFLPMRFEVRRKGEAPQDLMSVLAVERTSSRCCSKSPKTFVT